MLAEEPPYWGSWKGRVLEAIAIYNIRDWDGLLDHTELTPDSLNTVLSELYTLDIRSRKEEETYWIENETHQKYHQYFESQQFTPKPTLRTR